MATWLIGDIHGHREELDALLELIEFETGDRLIFVGDIVNGGNDNVGALRRVAELDAEVCLGNHDLHMLAVWTGAQKARSKDNFHDVLEAPDCDELMQWLLTRSIAVRDEDLNFLAVHAGVLPSWTADEVMKLAGEVENKLRGGTPGKLFRKMYGNKPDIWGESYSGAERRRLLVNAFTRMRVLDAAGRMDFSYSGTYSKIPKKWCAWFDHPERQTRETRIVFGHWSALGLRRKSNTVCLDSGVRWGGPLSAYRAEDGVVMQVPQSDGSAQSPG